MVASDDEERKARWRRWFDELHEHYFFITDVFTAPIVSGLEHLPPYLSPVRDAFVANLNSVVEALNLPFTIGTLGTTALLRNRAQFLEILDSMRDERDEQEVRTEDVLNDDRDDFLRTLGRS